MDTSFQEFSCEDKELRFQLKHNVRSRACGFIFLAEGYAYMLMHSSGYAYRLMKWSRILVFTCETFATGDKFGNVCRHFSVVITWEAGCSWHLVGRDQRCCRTACCLYTGQHPAAAHKALSAPYRSGVKVKQPWSSRNPYC